MPNDQPRSQLPTATRASPLLTFGLPSLPGVPPPLPNLGCPWGGGGGEYLTGAVATAPALLPKPLLPSPPQVHTPLTSSRPPTDPTNSPLRAP